MQGTVRKNIARRHEIRANMSFINNKKKLTEKENTTDVDAS